MPKGASGRIAGFIKRLIYGGDSSSTPVDVSQYGNLSAFEGATRSKPIEYVAVFDDTSANPIAAASGDRHSVGIPIGVPLANKVVTHNHPDSNWGGTFSFADMNVAISHGVRQMRAIGRRGEGGYALVKGANAQSGRFSTAVNRYRDTLERRMTNTANKARSAGLSEKVVRQNVVGVLHRFYQRHAARFGYTYQRMRGV